MLRRRLILSLGALTFFVAMFSYYTVWRIGLPLQIDVNEAWNAWQVERLIEGQRLYPDPHALIVNNYPPLSFLLIALLKPFFTSSLVAGRALSLASLAATAGFLYLSARRLGVHRLSAAIAALWLMASFMGFFSEYAGMNDPNLFGLAVMSGAFTLFLGASSPFSLIVAFSLMLIAGLIKHNLVALPLAAWVLLALKDRKQALAIGLYSIAMAALVSFILIDLYGPAFLDAMTMPREWSLLRPLSRIGRLQFVLPTLLFWGLWLTLPGRIYEKRVSIALVSAGFLANYMALTGAGVANNAQFELVYATGVCLALIIEELQGQRLAFFGRPFDAGLALIIVMIGRFVLWPFFDPYLLPLSSAYRASIADRVAILNEEVERVRAIEGPVTCSVRSVCYLAGKDFVFDEFAIEQRIKTGRVTREAINDEIKNLGITFVTNREEARWHLP